MEIGVKPQLSEAMKILRQKYNSLEIGVKPQLLRYNLDYCPKYNSLEIGVKPQPASDIVSPHAEYNSLDSSATAFAALSFLKLPKAKRSLVLRLKKRCFFLCATGSSRNSGRNWIVQRDDGEWVVYVDNNQWEDKKRRMVTIHVLDDDKRKGKILSQQKNPPAVSLIHGLQP